MKYPNSDHTGIENYTSRFLEKQPNIRVIKLWHQVMCELEAKQLIFNYFLLMMQTNKLF